MSEAFMSQIISEKNCDIQECMKYFLCDLLVHLWFLTKKVITH